MGMIADILKQFPPMILQEPILPDEEFDTISCAFGPPATGEEIREIWGDHPLPPEVVELWRAANTAELFTFSYGGMGLELWSPRRCHETLADPSSAALVREDLRPGDVVLGQFYEGEGVHYLLYAWDSERSLSTIFVTWALDSRDEWQVVADSLTSFLRRYLEDTSTPWWIS